MQPRHVVVIGTSAGGIEALRQLVGELPADFPAAIAVVLHTSPQSPGVLHDILTRSGSLPAISPHGQERLQVGYIYVAPPGFHMLIEPGRIRLSKGPKENRFRPAIDPLFRSAAQAYGPDTIGVVLTGNLDDGAAGLWTVKQLGGTTIVQDPNDAMFPSMPESALRYVAADHVLPLSAIPSMLVRLTAAPPRKESFTVPELVDVEVKIAREEDPREAGVHQLGEPSTFACPECHGVLLQVQEGSRIRFRCHTGHAYSPDSLLAEIREQIEVQLWNAIRALQEGSLLMQSMAAHVDAAHPSPDAAAMRQRAGELQEQADALRQMIASGSTAIQSK